MPAKTWLVEPRDSLVLHDARPSLGGEPMRTLAYPWPSSVAGLARSRAGENENGLFCLNDQDAQKLVNVEVAGPWLATLDPGGGVKDLAFVAPLDCLWHEAKDASQIERRRLVPSLGDDMSGVMSNMPGGMRWLRPVQDAPKRKPAAAPPFWTWPEYQRWLSTPTPFESFDKADFGLEAFDVEERVQVALDPETGRPLEGKLFSVEGLRLRSLRRRCALVFCCDDERIKPGPVHLGGERRISWLSQVDNALPQLPADLGQSGRVFRLILISPAIFTQGWRPQEDSVPDAKLIAAATGRPQPISGWDFFKRGPKMTRRMAPAGSVFWFELNDGVDAQNWVQERWMQSICDQDQDRKDGFGLCLVGVG